MHVNRVIQCPQPIPYPALHNVMRGVPPFRQYVTYGALNQISVCDQLGMRVCWSVSLGCWPFPCAVGLQQYYLYMNYQR